MPIKIICKECKTEHPLLEITWITRGYFKTNPKVVCKKCGRVLIDYEKSSK
jgi:hypothetical protein